MDDLKPGQRLPINAILRMFDALCSALDYAHTYTIHRDIKPENVMILPDGSVKLMDFGISKLMSNPDITSASIVMGTPRYMSPEQLRNTANVDARADVYSLGIMLYEVITGIPPTALGMTASETAREVPPALDPIIGKCVDPDPAKRYQSAADLRAALRKIRIAIETGASEQGAEAPAVSSTDRRGLRIAVGVALLAVILGAAVFGVIKAEGRRQTILEEIARSVPAYIPQDPANPAFDFNRITSLVVRGRARGTAALGNYTVEDQEEILQGIMETGDRLWAEAKANARTNPERALELAIDAMTCFVAPVIWPENMVFVTPGPVALGEVEGEVNDARVGGFFIDEEYVSMGEFSDFCNMGEGWRWPESRFIAPGAPMSQVAFYDALAFAATRRPAKRLPTDAQWVRAVSEAQARSTVAPPTRDSEFAVGAESTDAEEIEESPSQTAARFLYLLGGFREWTRSPWEKTSRVSQSSSEIGFGSQLVILGGRFDASGSFHMSPRLAQVYESAVPRVAFRGVLELPRSIEDLARLSR